MGTVRGNWLTGAHSGRACNHENIYTKIDRKTGKCYSVKLCNPNVATSVDQAAQRNAFGMISAALSSWIKQQKELNSDAYKNVKAQYDRQTKYSTLRGYMMAKNMAEVAGSNIVKITVSGEEFTVTVSGIVTSQPSGNGTSGSQNGGGVNAADEQSSSSIEGGVANNIH